MCDSHIKKYWFDLEFVCAFLTGKNREFLTGALLIFFSVSFGHNTSVGYFLICTLAHEEMKRKKMVQ